MKLKKSLLAMAMVSLWGGTAQAGLLVNNWDLSTAPAGQGLTVTVTGIDEMSYLGVDKAVKGADVGPAGLVGDVYTVTALGNFTQFTNFVAPPPGLGNINPPGLNLDPTASAANAAVCATAGVDCFEMTFRLDTTVTVTSAVGDDVDFDHNPGGILTLYIDSLEDGVGLKATSASAASYVDGAAVISFTDDGGPLSSGNFDLSTLNGNDDGHFSVSAANAIANLIGVFTQSGYDFGKTVGSDAHADSDFNFFGFPTFASLSPCGVSSTDFCATSDGSADLSRVPEPATLTLLGIGLLGLGAANRRRSK